MACADAALCASTSACAAVILVPALPCVHVGYSPALWALDVALLAPLVCCAFATPTTAMAVVSAPHWVEYDDDLGHFVGVEDDTLCFGEDGEALDLDDLYDPREDEEKEALQQLRRRRSLDVPDQAAEPTDRLKDE
jgi:hypothetical protein